jgi:hypothetical protein
MGGCIGRRPSVPDPINSPEARLTLQAEHPINRRAARSIDTRAEDVEQDPHGRVLDEDNDDTVPTAAEPASPGSRGASGDSDQDAETGAPYQPGGCRLPTNLPSEAKDSGTRR